MTASNPMTAMIDICTQTQQSLWDNWIGTLQTLQETPKSAEFWEKPLTVWSEQSQRLFETQQNLLASQSIWLKRDMPQFDSLLSMPKVVDDWVQQNNKLVESNAEISKRLLENYLTGAQQFDALEWIQTWNETMQETLQIWLTSMNSLMTFQMDLLQAPKKASSHAMQKTQEHTKESKTAKPAGEQVA